MAASGNRRRLLRFDLLELRRTRGVAMPKVAANGIEIYYEQFGVPSGRPLLLICGLGAHMTSWPQGFLDTLVAAGFFVTTYDNRDVGLSTHLDELGEPDSAAILFGTFFRFAQ